MTVRKAKGIDLEALLDIYNYEVENGVATFDIQLKSIEERRKWFDMHNTKNHPLLVAEKDGKVVGYASLSPYREREAFAPTVELSVYVDKDYRGMGVANTLMEAILEEAKRDERTHNVVSVITSGNEASVKLHKKFGFEYCGTIKEVGIKFGEYQAVEHYSLLV